jgi:hypothetical protein
MRTMSLTVEEWNKFVNLVFCLQLNDIESIHKFHHFMNDTHISSFVSPNHYVCTINHITIQFLQGEREHEHEHEVIN